MECCRHLSMCFFKGGLAASVRFHELKNSLMVSRAWKLRLHGTPMEIRPQHGAVWADHWEFQPRARARKRMKVGVAAAEVTSLVDSSDRIFW